MRSAVFVVGAPRSGTTLLRVLLGRHPQLAMWGAESDFFRRLYDRRSAFGDPSVPTHRARIVDAYLALEPVRRLGLDLPALRNRLLRDGVTWPALFRAMLQFNAESQGKPYAGEKTPAHAFYSQMLFEWFPGCAVIHIVRDPRDAASSLIRMPWSNRSVLAAARTWRRFNAAALEAAGRDGYLRLKYEDLVADPRTQLTTVCRYIGLDFDPALLEPADAGPPLLPPVARAGKPISAARRELWRKAFRPWQVAVIEETAGPLMETFGYEREAAPPTALQHARASAECIFEVGVQTLSRVPPAFFRYLQPTNLAAEARWIGRAGKFYWSLRPRPADLE